MFLPTSFLNSFSFVEAWEWACVHTCVSMGVGCVHTCADMLTHVATCESKSCHVVSSIHCFSIFFIFSSEIRSLTGPEPRTQDPAAFAPSAGVQELSTQSCLFPVWELQT